MIHTKTTLKSGARLVTIPLRGTKTTTVLIGVHAGSNFEEKRVNGISHFLEHMVFKGTPRRPTTLHIAEELDAIGGEYNAFTSKEWTGYYAKADRRHLPLLLDILSDFYLNATLDKEEMEREKLVIFEEMNMYQDTPAKYVDELAEELLYGNQPQGYSIIGSAHTVKGISQKDLRQYRHKRYTGKNTVVFIAGALPKDNIKKLVGQYLHPLSKGRSVPTKITVVEKQRAPQTLVHYKNTDQTHLSLTLRAYPAGHKNLPALKILNILLGGNMSSRLFINIREREGLGYYINSHVETYSGSGYLGIKAGVDNKRSMRALELILKELRAIRDQGVTPAELKKAHEYIRGKLVLSLETSDAFAFWLAAQEFATGRIKTPEQMLKKMLQVGARDVLRVAQEVIDSRKLNLAVIGPYKDKRKFTKLLTLEN